MKKIKKKEKNRIKAMLCTTLDDTNISSNVYYQHSPFIFDENSNTYYIYKLTQDNSKVQIPTSNDYYKTNRKDFEFERILIEVKKLNNLIDLYNSYKGILNKNEIKELQKLITKRNELILMDRSIRKYGFIPYSLLLDLNKENK